MKIELFSHASIKLIGDKIIYFDPYDVKDEFHDADYIFITHNHYDHYDNDSIMKVRKPDTKLIVPTCLKEKDSYLLVEPNNKYSIDNIKFETISSYNVNKPFHPKNMCFVGYNILLNDEYYYIMGDTDRTPETDLVKADICFVPIGGTYTMNVYEAIDYINNLNPKVAIPIHYGKIVGDKSLGEIFKNGIKKEIEVRIMI